ncbi:hypothetical protein LPJ57_008056, partial [Coemansia sp. RSA 486]
NLKHLYHTQFYDPSPKKTNIAREIAPFPCLEELCLFGAHPFTDDTVFRNNEKTLRRITMDMDDVGARVINQYETFAGHRYKNLKRLPALRKLYCEPDGLGTTKNKKYKESKDQHLAKAVAEVEIQNKCLQYWKIDSIKSHAVSTVATMVILVALSCPMFQYADVPKRIVPIYNAFILKAIAEEPLASHAERLKSLVIQDDE